MARNKSLDGVRGILALIVFCWHIASLIAPQAAAPLLPISQFAVIGFFVLSGLVLTRSWDGHYLAFLLRRFIRLWPIYAICLGFGYAIASHAVVYSEFFWWPLIPPYETSQTVLLPAWSLCVEAWAMLAMPLFVFVGKGRWPYLIAGIAACLMATAVIPQAIYGIFFFAGAFASRYEWRVTLLETRFPQWLGRVSYPLYLSQWLVLKYFPGPVIGRVIVALIVAQVLTVTVEQWSILASRRAGGVANRLLSAYRWSSVSL